MEEINETGGAKIGNANATWPFVKLKVNINILNVNASIIGNLVFRPSDIVSIVPYSRLFSSGIKINHNVQNYKTEVIFWTTGNSAELISRIEQTGFLNNTKPLSFGLDEEITARQQGGAFPIKTLAAIVIVVVWNLLFLSGIWSVFTGDSKNLHFGLGVQMALAFVFLTGLGLLVSEHVRSLVLKSDRTVDDVRIFVYFLMFVTGILFTSVTLIFH